MSHLDIIVSSCHFLMSMYIPGKVHSSNYFKLFHAQWQRTFVVSQISYEEMNTLLFK